MAQSTLTRAEYEARWADPLYRVRVVVLSREVDSDGCTGVPNFFLYGCYEHDVAYRTGRDPFGIEISRAEADRRLRWYISWRSQTLPVFRVQWRGWRQRPKLESRWLGYGMAWVRWAVVRPVGGLSWRGGESGTVVRSQENATEGEAP